LTSESAAAGVAKEDKNVEIENLALLLIWGLRMKWLSIGSGMNEGHGPTRCFEPNKVHRQQILMLER